MTDSIPSNTGFVCADCKNVFLQKPRCTTCGAEKLYDTTVRNLQEDNARYENGRVVMTEEIERLRMAERLNVETVARLQQERDALERNRDALEADLKRFVAHAARGVQPPKCIACEDRPAAENDPCLVCGRRSQPPAAALQRIINTYDAYRRRGVSPAPKEYGDVVDAIESARSYLTKAEPPKGPHVHSMVLDRLGWICSVCYGWNHQQDSHCTHTHAVTKAPPLTAEEEAERDWQHAERVFGATPSDPFAAAPLTGPGSRLEAQLAEPTCPPCRLELGGKRCDDCGYAPRLCGHDDGSQCDETCAEKVRAFREYHGLPPKRVAPETNESHSK